MKYVCLTLCALIICNNTFAGDRVMFAYFNAGVSTENSIYSAYGNKTTILSASPGIGYEFTPAIAAGLQGSYDQYKTATGLSADKNMTMHNWTAGAFLRYTRHTRTFIFPYAQLDLNYAGGTAMQKELGMQGYYSGMQVNIYPAIAVTLNSFAFTFSIGGISYYNHQWIENTAGFNNYNTTLLTFGRQLQLGIIKTFTVAKKKETSAEKI